MAVVSFHNVEEGLEMCDLEYEMCKEIEDQMVMVDNITSCNVVDNYLWLDEYKQNNNTLLYFTLASIHDIIVSTSEISSPLSESTLADPPRVIFYTWTGGPTHLQYKPSLHSHLNSEGREQVHSLLQKVSSSFRQMNYSSFMHMHRVFSGIRNIKSKGLISGWRE